MDAMNDVDPLEQERADSYIENLIHHLTDEPNLLHRNQTQAGIELIAIGEKCLPYVLDVLLKGDPDSRFCAEHVVYSIMFRMHGVNTPYEAEYPDAGRRVQILIDQLGRISCTDDYAVRSAL